MGLVMFGIHLVLLGYMIYRSQYIPRIIGVLLVYDGLGWVIVSLQPYFYPSTLLRCFFVTSFVELVRPFWLLIRGWRIEEPGVLGTTIQETCDFRASNSCRIFATKTSGSNGF